MDVLLVNPPVRENKPPKMFPLGLGYISRILLDEGHNVSVLDIDGYRYNREQVKELVGDYDFDVVGTGGLITTYNYVKFLIPLFKNKNPNAKVVVGGSLASSVPELVLKELGADVAVIGEGEETARELFNAIENKDDLGNVDGIYYRDDGQIQQTPMRKPIKNLDEIPFPQWDLFPMHIYLKNPIVHYFLKRSMNVSSARGCPYPCTFCYKIPPSPRRLRLRSVESVVEEIKELRRRYNVSSIYFADNLFLPFKKRGYDFCDELERNKIDIKWMGNSRVKINDDLDLLKRMKEMGCVQLGYGIESGSDKILKIMKKGFTAEEAKHTIELTRKARISFNTSFIIGMPGETEETVQETVQFMKELNLRDAIFLATPYPDTPLYEYAKNKGVIGDEARYVEKLGDCDHMVVNLTDLPDEELLRLYEKAKAEMNKNLNMPKYVWDYYRTWGLKRVLARGFKMLSNGS